MDSAKKCKARDVTEAVLLLSPIMENRDFQPSITVCNAVLDCLCKNNSLKEALDHFYRLKEKLIKPDTTTYNSLIHFTLSLGQQKRAFFLLTEM
ncbi:hypothetical protein V6N12_022470 [Hibiscus sabdariffa]|uniref:Pentatricopeptide repeat-containing protein n=1 Tax=Hibiscus sabdariffa TaxID=183260 RepID=A0ABR2FUS5_9ROSI